MVTGEIQIKLVFSEPSDTESEVSNNDARAGKYLRDPMSHCHHVVDKDTGRLSTLPRITWKKCGTDQYG